VLKKKNLKTPPFLKNTMICLKTKDFDYLSDNELEQAAEIFYLQYLQNMDKVLFL